ncbi:MAG: DUF3800 domain-containing protein [Gemmataceae bacterium]|nr:DUF3800 domain-containing protein [Gemmataceae bacterium]
MPTFIDESGDTGHEPDSATHFRLAAVWVPTHEVADAFRAGVLQLRQRLRLPAAYEFKFAKTGARPERRTAFFEEAMRHEFRFAAASVDKREGEWRDAERGAIHRACAVSLAATLRPTYRVQEAVRAEAGKHDRPLGELVVVDDNQDQEFLAAIKEKFRGLASGCRRGAPLVGKVKFRGSGPDELLQLADMVCGAVVAHLDGESTWYRLIASRDLGITPIP